MPAIRPVEALKLKIKDIPEEVLEVWNELIVKNLSGSSSTILQKDAAAAIAQKMNVASDYVYESGWLDIEKIYRSAGWKVVYDKPGYNESYHARFEFTTKRRT